MSEVPHVTLQPYTLTPKPQTPHPNPTPDSLDRVQGVTPARTCRQRRIDSCITQLKAQGPSRTCNESKEEEAPAVNGHQEEPPPPRPLDRARYLRPPNIITGVPRS